MATSYSFAKTVDMATQCPFCGKTFDFPMCTEIVIPGDNKLKKRVLNKTLFCPKCPSCGEEFKLKPSCIYRNETKRELFVMTDSKEAEFKDLMKTGDLGINDIKTEDDITEFTKGLYKRRVVHDIDAFREKILLSDNNYDDRIIELMKYSLSGLIEKENHMPVYRIFLEEAPGTQLLFTAILGSCAPFEYITIKSDSKIYNQYKERYQKRLGRAEEDEYISTDQKWAEGSGLLENEEAGFIVPIE